LSKNKAFRAELYCTDFWSYKCWVVDVTVTQCKFIIRKEIVDELPYRSREQRVIGLIPSWTEHFSS